MAQLEVDDVVVSYGDVVAVNGISFSVSEGELVTLLGPSGCGKTTTLRCIAGLEPATSGTIRIADEVVASRSVLVPPEKRGINMVFQSYAVWPHMTVADNVGYGLRTRRVGKDERTRRVDSALRLVGLEDYGERYGTELSGGQQQRVALARAVVTEPRLLLFDEPLSNLDAGLRTRMRLELVQLQKKVGTTAIYVTHDQTEAMVMSDRIILMRDGNIVQSGTPSDLYERPTSRFAAEFIGVSNFIDVTVRSKPDHDGHVDVVTEAGKPLRAVLPDATSIDVGARALATVRPENVVLGSSDETSVNRWDRATITELVYLGNKLECKVDVGDHQFHVEAHPARRLELATDAEPSVTISSSSLVVVPLDSKTEQPSDDSPDSAAPAGATAAH